MILFGPFAAAAAEKTTSTHSAPEGCRHVSYPLGLFWVHPAPWHPCYGFEPDAMC